MKIGYYLIILFLLIGSSTSAIGQTLAITMLSNPSITVNSANAYINGVTISNTTLRTFVRKNTPWSLSVRAASTDLTNGVSIIPANQIKMQVTNTTVTNRPLITLSATNQTLASDLSIFAGDRTTDLIINYTLTGGAGLLKSSGNYSTTLTFTMSIL